MRNFAVAFMFGLLAFSSPALAEPNSPPQPLPCAKDTNPAVCVLRGESSKAFGQAVAENARNGIHPPVSP
jgi:hypothetical protein